MILLIVVSWLFTSVRTQVCDGCMQGPVQLPYYFCQCPYSVNPELSACIKHCANDVLCRFCYGDVYYGIPPLCPLIVEQEIDLSGPYFDFVIKCGAEIIGLSNGTGTDLIFFDPVTRYGRANLILPELIIKGKYKVKGKFCGNKYVESEGYVSIKFENVTVDWYPELDLTTKCTNIFLYINAANSKLYLSTNKKVRFEFKENGRKSECKLSKCVNENWDKILAQILDPLQQFFNNFCTKFSNIILLQVKYTDLFSATQVPPTIVSAGIPQGPLPVTIGQVSLPVQNQVLPGGAVVVPTLPGGSTGGQPVTGGNINALPGVAPPLPGAIGSAISGLPLGSVIPTQGSSSSGGQALPSLSGTSSQNLGSVSSNLTQGSSSSGVPQLLPGVPIQNIDGVPSTLIQGSSVNSGGPPTNIGNTLQRPASSVTQNSGVVDSVVQSPPNLDPSAITGSGASKIPAAPVATPNVAAPVVGNNIPAGQPAIVNLAPNLALLTSGGTGRSDSGAVSNNLLPSLSALPLVG